MTYLRLQRRRQRAARARSTLVWIGDVVKYLVLLRVLLGSLYLVIWQPVSPLTTLVRDGSAGSGGFLVVVGAAVLCAQFGVRVTATFPTTPFSRFCTDRQWVARSYYYPLFSSTLAVALIALVSIFGARGVLFFVYFYLTYLVSVRVGWVRVCILIMVFTGYTLALGEGTLRSMVAVLVLIPMVHEFINPVHSIGGRVDILVDAHRWPILRKELACLGFYSSDQVYVGVCFVMLVAAYGMLLPDVGGGQAGSAVLSLLPWLAVLPFSRILLNLFGTDVAALQHFRRAPRRAIDYQLGRIRLYRVPIYVIHSAVTVGLYVLFRRADLMAVYALSAIAFTELVGGIALVYSVQFVERKPVGYEYGQHLGSRSIHLSSLVYLVLALTIYAIDRMGGIVALGLVAIVALTMSTRLLSVMAQRLLVRRFVPYVV